MCITKNNVSLTAIFFDLATVYFRRLDSRKAEPNSAVSPSHACIRSSTRYCIDQVSIHVVWRGCYPGSMTRIQAYLQHYFYHPTAPAQTLLLRRHGGNSHFDYFGMKDSTHNPVLLSKNWKQEMYLHLAPFLRYNVVCSKH